MTGDAAIYGSSAEEGAQLAVAEINAAGGIDGKNIELVAYDSKADQTEAINAYNRLRDQDGVVAVIGGTLSGETLAMKDIMVSDNMPVLSPTATAVEVTQDAPNVFRACFLDDYQGQAAANFAATTLGAKTAALLIGTGNPYSEGVSEAFKAAFTAKGGTIAGSESYGTADKDFSAQLTKIKEMNPDVVFVPDYVQTVGTNSSKKQKKWALLQNLSELMAGMAFRKNMLMPLREIISQTIMQPIHRQKQFKTLSLPTKQSMIRCQTLLQL